MKLLSRSVAVLCLLALAACGSAMPSSEESQNSSAAAASRLAITLTQVKKEDSFGIPHVTAVLHLSGAVMQEVALPEVVGTLSIVDPAAAPQYGRDTETVALLSSWYAGAGQEIRLVLRHEPLALVIDHRYGDEGTAETPGQCDAYAPITTVALPGPVHVELREFGTPVAASALGYCGE